MSFFFGFLTLTMRNMFFVEIRTRSSICVGKTYNESPTVISEINLSHFAISVIKFSLNLKDTHLKSRK